MSSSFGERIKEMRVYEGVKPTAFANEVGINIGTLKDSEEGRIKSVGEQTIKKICNHERFKKYTLWLITGESNPKGGQIAPGESITQSDRIPRELLDAAFLKTIDRAEELDWISIEDYVSTKMLTDLMRSDYVKFGGELD